MHRVIDPKALIREMGERMRLSREMANISRDTAAKKLGFKNTSGLAKIEMAKDIKWISIFKIIEAAKLYHVSTDYILCITDDWEIGIPDQERLVNIWLQDQIEQSRTKDLAVLVKLKRYVNDVLMSSANTTETAFTFIDVLEKFISRNKEAFEDLPGGSKVMMELERLRSSVISSSGTIKKYQRNLALSPVDTRQLELLV